MSARPIGAPPARGLLEALRAIGATLAETARVRGALFGIELRDEVERRKRMLLRAALAAVLLHMALLVATAFVAVAFWDTYRLGAIGAMAALYLAGAAVVLQRMRAEAAASPEPFAATVGELERDFADLRVPR